nr:uncharacterized protein LOC129280391 [Lytechinus pictus]
MFFYHYEQNADWSVDNDFISILLTGKLTQNHRRKTKPRMVAGHNFLGALYIPLTQHGTFLEVGTGVTGLYLSQQDKMKSLVAAVITPEPLHDELVQLSNSYDAFIGSVSSRNIKSLVKNLVQDPEVFFGSILLSNLSALIGDNLPHEFEKLLGQVILLAKETYIAAPSTDSYTLSYMNTWNDVQNLAERACYSVDVICAISAVQMDSLDLPALTKVTLIEGQRPLTRKYCCDDSQEDCSMTYRTVNGTEDVIIGDSYLGKVRFQKAGLLLSTLLKLNPVGASLEKLVVPLLEMDFNPERLARNILIANRKVVIHSELPSCQRAVFENDRMQQERNIADIVGGLEEKKSTETMLGNKEVSLKGYQQEKKKYKNDGQKTNWVKNEKSPEIQSYQSNDQNLVMNMHTKYASMDSVNQNMHAVHANEGLNMHNEYANGDGGESEKLYVQGDEKRQSVDGVGKSQSAIIHNQRAFKSVDESLKVHEGKVEFTDNDYGLQQDSVQPHIDMNNVGLHKEMDNVNTNMNNMGLQNGLNLADRNLNNMGLNNGVQLMNRRQRGSVGWDGDDEAEQRQLERPLEWERAREELDGYRGAGPMRSQIDMVADLWQRENDDGAEAKRNPEVPGSNWDREMDVRSSNDQASSKLVAMGNLLLTRDEGDPPVQERGWDRVKQDKQDEGRTAHQESGVERKSSNRRNKKVDEVGGSRNMADQRSFDEMSNTKGGHPGVIPPGNAQNRKSSMSDNYGVDLKAADASIRKSEVPVKGIAKTEIGGRFPKQRRKKFRQPNERLQGIFKEGDPKSVDKMIDSKQALTPSGPTAARKATEVAGEEVNREKDTVLQMDHYQQRHILQYYDDDVAYNVKGEMESNDNTPIEIQQEIDAQQKMLDMVARQQEQGGEPTWEELESNAEEQIKEDIGEENGAGDYYYDEMKQDVKGKDIPQEAEEGYYGNEAENTIQDEGKDKDEMEDGWRGVSRSRQVGANKGEDEDEEEEIGKILEEMESMKETEGEKMFDSMWQVLETVFQEEQMQEFSLMTYGGKELSLLSAKVSRSFPNASILTIIPSKEGSLLKNHRKLQESLLLTNNIIVNAELSNRVVFKLYNQMEYFKFQVLGLATFQKLLYGGSFPSFLGHALSLAQTTFIEVPHPVTLASLQVLLHSTGMDAAEDSSYSLYKGFLSASLTEAGVLDYSITVLDNVYLENRARLVRVDIYAFNRQVSFDCLGSTAWLKQDSSKPITLNPHGSAAAGNFPIQKVGGAIRLQSLLSLGLQTPERKLLFREYLKLAVHNDMCPMTILWQRGRLIYRPIIDNTNPEQHKPCANDKEALVEVLMKQLEIRPFSFMEYGKGQDGLSMTLSTKHPNSTFIFVTGSGKEAKRRQDDLVQRNITNAVVTSILADMSFTSNLLSSPDFMRYQYVGVDHLLNMMTFNQRAMMKAMFGDIVASGVTTFFQMPSSQMISLAVSTLFPEAFCDFTDRRGMDVFQARNHPLPVFRNFELSFLKKNIELQAGQVNLSASVLHPETNQDGSKLGWSMVRVDVRQLYIKVDHHFMYILDGHKRKYSLHCTSNETHYEVYLVRAHDGFKIPYQEVKGISLIALLRMGLLRDVKENFYNQFLKLPLYGDMAPWNILFSGGKLEYIDYDTKQMMFDKVAPAAYQIMAMLMNYRRTVQDFGHCQFDGRNPYGFDLVSHCVGNDFKGPCQDERFPVACADQTCRPNYIECLRVLGEIEEKHSGIKAMGIDAPSSSRAMLDENISPYEDKPDTEERLELSFKGSGGKRR